MTPNIAIIGLAGVGKSVVARALFQGHDYRRMSWADGVRDIFEMAYGDIGDYGVMKRKRFPVRAVTGAHTELSGRQLLQRIGTEAIRDNVDQDFWVKAGIRRMLNAPPIDAPWVNDDTRFENEAEALRALGDWVIVRLVGPASSNAGSHTSETSIALIEEDIAIETHDINGRWFTPAELAWDVIGSAETIMARR